jgi:hypothetical protein
LRAKLFTLPGTVKGRLLLKTGKATVFQMRSVSWIVYYWHETDMHPIDLILESSMIGYAEILTGVPDAIKKPQGSGEKL